MSFVVDGDDDTAAAAAAEHAEAHYNVIADVSKDEVGVDVDNLVCIVGFECVDRLDWLCFGKIKKNY